MGRWEPDSKGRLQEAAFELFLERGFEQTTAVQIAAKAGVTERTFFRHFADKREVFFVAFPLLRDGMLSALEQAPGSAGALEAVGHALQAAAGFMGDGRRDLIGKRQAVIAATPELRERELVKFADLAAAMAAVLRGRGVADPQAELAAETGLAVLRVAIDRWAKADRGPGLGALVDDGLARLRALAAEG